MNSNAFLKATIAGGMMAMRAAKMTGRAFGFMKSKRAKQNLRLSNSNLGSLNNIDEPDKSLHILLQYELAKYLRTNYTNQNNIFILITSHSPFIIPDLNENIYITELNEKGCTNIVEAKNVNDIRNAGIFPLITLFQLEKFKNEMAIDLNDKIIRFYYNDTKNNDNNKKIESCIKNILQNRFDYQLIPISNEESKHLLEIKTSDFFQNIYMKKKI